MPGPTAVIKEWFSQDPTYGLSIYTAEYYQHIWVSVRRVLIAFFLATVLGVPLGLFLGWSKKFKEYVFPVFETAAADPDPRLGAARDRDVQGYRVAGDLPDLPGLVLRHRAQHHARRRVDRRVLHPRRQLPRREQWQVFRHVIVPGALPFIFTGLADLGRRRLVLAGRRRDGVRASTASAT